MRTKLEGVKVLDLSRVLAGPFCSMILADMGAEVIKVEPPGGDETRTWPPFIEDESGYFMALNRNKKGMVLDLKNPKGKMVVFDLVRKCDVFIENFTPGVTSRLEIDYEAIAKVNPQIIYCSISGFGQTGPYRNKRAYDPVIQAIGGAMSITGVKGGEPVKIGIPVGDLGGSLFAVMSILSSLYHREKYGQGDYIDVAMLDGQISLLSIMAAEFFANGSIPMRWGLEHPWRVPSKTFRTKDGYITASATSGTMYPKLCQALGVEELVADPRFKTNALRVQNRNELYPILDAKMMSKTAREWEQIFEKVGLPCGVMNTLDEVFADPHVLARGMLEYVQHPKLGELKMIGIPFKFKHAANSVLSAPPMFGEHTEQILRNVAGYSLDAIKVLRDENVVV